MHSDLFHTLAFVFASLQGVILDADAIEFEQPLAVSWASWLLYLYLTLICIQNFWSVEIKKTKTLCRGKQL